MSEVTRAAEIVRAHPRRAELGALSLDLLSRMAEGRLLFTGKELVATRAKEHRVTREDADTEGGNLLALLERAPESELERDLVAAFAVAALREADEARLVRFVRHADWLEESSPFSVYGVIDAVLEDEAARVWEQVAAAALAEANQDAPAVRARGALRSAVLGRSKSTAARAALARLAADAEDPAVRAIARALGGTTDAEDEPERSTLRGVVRRVRGSAGFEVLRWMTGIALLSGLVHALGFALGVRRDAELTLVRGGVKVRTQVALLGRTVRDRTETFTHAALASAARETRYPALPALIGAIALSVGVLAGGVLLVDGARTMELQLLGAGAALVLAGALVDLGLDVLWPVGRGQVAVTLRALPRRAVQIGGLSQSDADAFLRALARSASGE